MIDYKILDAWEANYIRNLEGRELLAWSDAEAVYRYPKLKWVYDKYQLSKYFDMVPTWDLWNDYPKRYPVFVKPRINLNGMGAGSGVIESISNLFDKGYIGSHIAQKNLVGEHISTDLVFDGEELIDYFSFLCHKNIKGSFWLFQSIDVSPTNRVIRKLSKIGQGRRVMNVETIGGAPIEVHLRPSLQFYDICGGLIRQLPGFIKGENWKKVKRERSYSRVYRRRHDCRAARPRSQPDLPRGVRSIQYCWENQKRLSKHGQDPYSYKYLVINGSNLRAIEDYGRLLNKLIKFYP